MDTNTSTHTTEDLAARFFAAIEAGDIATLGSIYSPDAVIWHNTDNSTQDVSANLALLVRLTGVVTNWRYTEVRRTILDDGFVQQHVLRGDAPGGELNVPAMLRVWVVDSRITRLDEYVDGETVFKVLRRPR